MKSLIRAALAIVVSLASTSLYAADFEGTIELSIESFGSGTSSSQRATGFIKGSLLKIDPKDGAASEAGVEGYPIIDFGKKRISLISPKDRYYMDLPLSQFEGPIAKQGVKLKKSGRSDTLLGLQAEEWVLDDASSPVSAGVWATKDKSLGFNLFVSMQKTYPEYGLLLGRMGKVLAEMGYMPLKAVIADKGGREKLRWTVLNVSERTLADSEFAIPEGYGKMGDMLKKTKKPGGR